MIVVSQSLVLSPGDVDLNAGVIGWRNLVTTANLAADGAADGYPATNLANPSTASGWRGADASEQYLTLTTGTEDEIDYLAIARHNFGSEGIVVSVEGYIDSAWEEIVEETQLPNDRPAIFRFDPQPLSEVRLRMQSGDAAPRCAVLYAGKLLVLQRRTYVGHTPMPYGRRTSVVTGRSETGEFLGRVITGEHTESAVALQNLTPGWYRSDLDPFVEASRALPFFYAWRPQSYPLETGYAAMTNEPKPVNQRSNGMMQIDFQFAGL